MVDFWRGGSKGYEWLEAVLILAALIWAGMIVGVSFLATPAKFGAPSLTLPVALDVGRHTFAVFMPIEIGLAAIVTGLALLSRRRAAVMLMVLVDVMVALQVAWLLPALDSRVAIILAGGEVPDSPLHWFYIGFEATKLLALTTIGALSVFHRRLEGSRTRIDSRSHALPGVEHRTSSIP